HEGHNTIPTTSHNEMNVLPIVGSAAVSVHDLVIRAQLCLDCRHQIDELRSERRALGVGLHFIQGNELFPFFRQYRAVEVIHETNAKNLLNARGDSLNDTIVAAELYDATPLQSRNATDG